MFKCKASSIVLHTCIAPTGIAQSNFRVVVASGNGGMDKQWGFSCCCFFKLKTKYSQRLKQV